MSFMSFMLSDTNKPFMLNIDMPNVVMLSVIMLNLVVPHAAASLVVVGDSGILAC